MKRFNIQLHDHVTRGVIQDSGGVVYVAAAGGTAKIAVATSANGTAATSNNPVSLTNGLIEFWTADTVMSVDLYVMCPSGQFLVAKSIVASGPNELFVDTNARDQVAVIPFDIADTTATTETDTGFDLTANMAVQPDGLGVKVDTVDTSRTIDVGMLASESSGDANGLIDGVSVATSGVVPATVGYSADTATTWVDLASGDQEFTYGVLIAKGTEEGSNSDTDEGFYLLQPYVPPGTRSVSYTLSSSADTAAGFIYLPYKLYLE